MFTRDVIFKILVVYSQFFLSADCRLELCDNNIQGEKLTSGYKSGQDVTKPISELFSLFLTFFPLTLLEFRNFFSLEIVDLINPHIRLATC